jgi:signal transduction histidine kinase
VPAAAAPWIDAAWVTVVVAVSQATSGVFYPLYLFAMVGASFGAGFRRGIAVAIACAAGFSLVGALTAPAGTDLRVFVIRPLYLLVLGYLAAVWGEHEVRSRARLALLREVTRLSNPRLGVEPAIGRILEAIRAFFDAQTCRMVVREDAGGACWMRAAAREGGAAAATALPPDVADVLLPGPAEATLLARARRSGTIEVALDGGAAPEDGGAAGERLLVTLEGRALLSVPFRYHATAAGRVHVVRARGKPFDRGDAEFLRHVLDQVTTLLDNLRLVDRLASEASADERRRIARDLHDSVIQPYVGLRLGLSAAATSLDAGRLEEARAHVARLARLADGEIGTLRRYVTELRAGADPEAPLETLRSFCRRFSDATGIRVDLSTAGDAVDERAAPEVFHVVAEALANVRRHTEAGRARVRVESSGGRVRVTVTNDGAAPEAPRFRPRSLEERAAALGGRLEVAQPAPGTTEVRVEFPL